VGSFTGYLYFSTDKPETGTFIIDLSGTGTDFSLGSAPSQTITTGQTATYDLTLSSSGFSGIVTLRCSGAPPGSSCRVNPNSITIDPGGAVPYVVSVTTTPQAVATSSGGDTNLWARTILAFSLGLWGVALGPIQSKMRRALLIAIIGSVLFGGSCGGGGNSASGSSGTPSGTYDLTVTGSVGSSSRTTTVRLIVQ